MTAGNDEDRQGRALWAVAGEVQMLVVVLPELIAHREAQLGTMVFAPQS